MKLRYCTTPLLKSINSKLVSNIPASVQLEESSYPCVSAMVMSPTHSFSVNIMGNC